MLILLKGNINQLLDCFLLDSLAKVDGGTVTKCNFAGDEKAGASWTNKILSNRAETGSEQQPVGGEGAGAEEDEWVRGLNMRALTHTNIL